MNDKNITEYKEILKSIDTLSSLKKILLEICLKYDYSYVMYNIQINNSFEDALYIAVGNYPKLWLERYISNNYASIDPIIVHCIKNETPIFWHELFDKKQTSEIIDFFSDASSFGLANGLSKSLRVSQNEVGMISFAKGSTLPEQLVSSDITEAIILLQPYIHHTLIRLSPEYRKLKKKLLTARELDVLYFLNNGYTAAQIGNTLNISESTAVFHIKNFIEKLDAKNRTHAVSKAILLGLLHPNTYHDTQENSYFVEN